MSWGRAVARGGHTAAGLALGLLADALWGDPQHHHPVAWFGTWATQVESWCWSDSRLRGAGYVAVTVAPWVLGAGAIHHLTRGCPWARVASTAMVTWAVVGAHSLRSEATVMERLLRASNLPAARQRLSHLCSRDSSALDANELARATIESVCENTSDAVIAPLLWGAVAGVPGLVLFRAINTLDAMVGYRNARYERFGWSAARLDDAMGIFPSRLTAAVTVAVAARGGTARQAWKVWRRDAAGHLSPNAGPVEASAAGALGIRLGGAHSHSGTTVNRAALGGEFFPPTVDDVDRAVRLSRAVSWWGAASCLALAMVITAGRKAVA